MDDVYVCLCNMEPKVVSMMFPRWKKCKLAAILFYHTRHSADKDLRISCITWREVTESGNFVSPVKTTGSKRPLISSWPLLQVACVTTHGDKRHRKKTIWFSRSTPYIQRKIFFLQSHKFRQKRRNDVKAAWESLLTPSPPPLVSPPTNTLFSCSKALFFHCFLDLTLHFVDTCRCQQVNSKQIVSSAVLRRPRSGRDLRRRTLMVLAFHGKVVDCIFVSLRVTFRDGRKRHQVL